VSLSTDDMIAAVFRARARPGAHVLASSTTLRAIRTSADRIRRQDFKKLKRSESGKWYVLGTNENAQRKVAKRLLMYRKNKNEALGRVGVTPARKLRRKHERDVMRDAVSRIRSRLRKGTRRAEKIVKETLERPKPASLRLAIIGHASNLAYLGAYCMTDIIGLRIVSVVAGSAGVAFNYLQPSGPLWVPVFWGCVFIGLNIFFIGDNLLKDKVSFTAQELEIYEQHFQSHHVSVRNFRDIYAASRTMTYSEGDTILEQGKPVSHVYMLIEGQVKVEVDGRSQGTCGPGTLIGNVPASTLTPNVALFTNTVTSDDAVVLVWDVEYLRQTMDDKNSNLSLPLISLMHDQAAKDVLQLNDAAKELNKLTYEQMLRTALSSGFVSNATRKHLREFRKVKGISDEDHERLLHRCGWSLGDFQSQSTRALVSTVFYGLMSGKLFD